MHASTINAVSNRISTVSAEFNRWRRVTIVFDGLEAKGDGSSFGFALKMARPSQLRQVWVAEYLTHICLHVKWLKLRFHWYQRVTVEFRRFCQKFDALGCEEFWHVTQKNGKTRIAPWSSPSTCGRRERLLCPKRSATPWRSTVAIWCSVKLRR
jgi:hypothetical protein